MESSLPIRTLQLNQLQLHYSNKFQRVNAPTHTSHEYRLQRVLADLEPCTTRGQPHIQRVSRVHGTKIQTKIQKPPPSDWRLWKQTFIRIINRVLSRETFNCAVHLQCLFCRIKIYQSITGASWNSYFSDVRTRIRCIRKGETLKNVTSCSTYSFTLKIGGYDNSVLSGNYYEEISTISSCLSPTSVAAYWLACPVACSP